MLHAISHKVALYFVAPVGGAAVATNFLQHRNPLVLLWGLTGLSFVLLANVHLAFLHTRWLPPPLPAREGGHPLARLEAGLAVAAARPTGLRRPQRPGPGGRGLSTCTAPPYTPLRFLTHTPSGRTRSTTCCTSGTR